MVDNDTHIASMLDPPVLKNIMGEGSKLKLREFAITEVELICPHMPLYT